MMALVTGGASSGKSACAEKLAVACGGALVYLATMRPTGDEGARRVARHRSMRAGKGFSTVECYGQLEGALATGAFDGATVLLEDLGNLVANELFGGVQKPALAGDAGVGALARRAANLVVVGNEVGCDGVAYERETRCYLEALGRLACEVAAGSDFVIECVAGVPVVVKAPEGRGSWAESAWAFVPGANGGRL